MKRYLSFWLVVLWVTTGLHDVLAQMPAAEMRGTWIATVANIDWPSKPGLPSERQRAEFDSILDVLQSLKMNAVFVQVRPAGDAFFPNRFAPWSKYLSGKQGVGVDYDPLDYMIKAAHARRMEFHAWLNPLRATFDLDTASLDRSHLLRILPAADKAKWFFRYGKRYYFNPAHASVVAHLTEVVGDIVTRYDVDGIHFDDYFYPYPEQGESIPDYSFFSQDPRGFSNIADWRRDNVNRLIAAISGKIRSIKPYVKFGISPFGVWRNKSRDPERGSDTQAGITCYDDLYADVLLWLKNDWIDYVAPQLYWSIGFPIADYQKLVDWWLKNTYGKHLYIGHAVYKIGNSTNDPNWNNRSEIGRQITLNRNSKSVHGSIFYSARQILRNPLNAQDSIRERYFSYTALMPGMGFRSPVPPATPKICRVKGSPSTVKLAWNTCQVQTGEEMPYYFAIYKFPGEWVGDFRDPKNLAGITAYNPEQWIFEDKNVFPDEYYTYVVTAFNRYNVESFSSEPVLVKKTRRAIQRKRIFGLFF